MSDCLTKKVFRSLGQTDKSDDRVGHLNTIKSSNARGLLGGGGGGGGVEVSS